MPILVRCEVCKLMFEGLPTQESCPKCQQKLLKIVARWPDEKESYPETFALAGIAPDEVSTEKLQQN